MDWNNINRDRDTSGLGPIEYDQTKVPALIRKHADNVRTKTYGQEVREAQARNAELAGLMANEAEIKANNADLLSKDTQNRFKDQIEGTTNSDEIIDARRPFGKETFQTLGERLDQSDDTLDTIKVDISSRGVNAESFGLVLDGVTDDSVKFQELIDLCSQEGLQVILPSKKILLESTIVLPSNTWIIGQGPKTVLQFASGITGFKIDDTSAAINIKIMDLTIQATLDPAYLSENSGIEASSMGVQSLMLENIRINNFKYGLLTNGLYWYSSQKNVRYNNNYQSIRVNGDNNINNSFDNVYTNRAVSTGVYLSGFYGSLTACNFGGRDADVHPAAKLLEITGNSSIAVNGSNFEHGRADTSIISIGGISRVSITGSSIWRHTATTNSDYIIEVKGGAYLNYKVNRDRSNTGFKGFILQNDYSRVETDDPDDVTLSVDAVKQAELRKNAYHKKVMSGPISQKESSIVPLLHCDDDIKIKEVAVFLPDGTSLNGGASFKLVNMAGQEIYKHSIPNSQLVKARYFLTPSNSGNYNLMRKRDILWMETYGVSTYNSQKFYVEVTYES